MEVVLQVVRIMPVDTEHGYERAMGNVFRSYVHAYRVDVRIPNLDRSHRTRLAA